MTGTGKALTHVINGMAGNIESHSILEPDQPVLNITNVLNYVDYGFSKLHVINETMARWEYIKGDSGIVGDALVMVKQS